MIRWPRPEDMQFAEGGNRASLLLNCSAFDGQQSLKVDSGVKRLVLTFDTIGAERRRRFAARDRLVTLP